jgi:hypothetical protein
MAIVINGSGTLSGLAVGGLPDGTVDSGTLATDSVVTGKIADGTIANADINSSAAIAGSKISSNANKILKEVAYDEVAGIAASSTSFASGNTVTFVKEEASADSIIVYSWNGYLGYYNNAGSYIDWRMGYTPSGGSIAYTDTREMNWQNFHSASVDGRLYWPMNYQIVISTLAAGSHTFVMQCRWGGGTNNNSQLNTDTHHNILIREVLI